MPRFRDLLNTFATDEYIEPEYPEVSIEYDILFRLPQGRDLASATHPAGTGP